MHKIILVQNDYFNGMFRDSWKEAGLDTITLIFDDSNITLKACEFIFARLYGHTQTFPTDELELIGILATSCYFGDLEIATECTSMITNALNPSNLSLLLTFARKDYYGAPVT